jgi:hypothetical protein
VYETPKYSIPCKAVNRTAIYIVATEPLLAQSINLSTKE